MPIRPAGKSRVVAAALGIVVGWTGLAISPTLAATVSFNQNLIVNGDTESDVGSSTGSTIGSMTGFTTWAISPS
jgi:hypothetical protein